LNILIIGGGKLGAELIDCLNKEDHNIALIDTNYKTVERFVGKYDILGVHGNGANIDTLREAGIEKTDILIAATASDEINVLSALIGNKLGARHTVVRVRAPEYSKQLVFMRKELGMSMMINPDAEAAREIARTLRSNRNVKMESFSRGRAELIELNVTSDFPFANLRLMDLYKIFKFKILVCAVLRGDDVHIPDGNFKIEVGDRIYVTASRTDLNELFQLLGFSKQRVRSAFIIGGGALGYYLAKELTESEIKVKIVDASEKRCVELSELLPEVSIVCGSGNDEALLFEEGIEKYDAVVTLTGIDEENIILALSAKYMGVPYVIAKVNNMSFIKLTDEKIDTVISPKAISANSIVKYVRSQEENVGEMLTFHKLVDNMVEAVEFVAQEDAKYLNIPLKNMKLKKGILIACIVRSGKVIIPGGGDVIEPHDNVIIVSKDRYLRNLEEILA